MVMKQRGLICREELQGPALLYVYIADMSLSSACGWCATSNPSLGYRGGVKGDLCAGSILQSGQGKARSECSHRWVWMGKKDLQLLHITWLRVSHAGESCVDGDTALRPLR